MRGPVLGGQWGTTHCPRGVLSLAVESWGCHEAPARATGCRPLSFRNEFLKWGIGQWEVWGPARTLSS